MVYDDKQHIIFVTKFSVCFGWICSGLPLLTSPQPETITSPGQVDFCVGLVDYSQYRTWETLESWSASSAFHKTSEIGLVNLKLIFLALWPLREMLITDLLLTDRQDIIYQKHVFSINQQTFTGCRPLLAFTGNCTKLTGNLLIC